MLGGGHSQAWRVEWQWGSPAHPGEARLGESVRVSSRGVRLLKSVSKRLVVCARIGYVPRAARMAAMSGWAAIVWSVRRRAMEMERVCACEYMGASRCAVDEMPRGWAEQSRSLLQREERQWTKVQRSRGVLEIQTSATRHVLPASNHGWAVHTL